MPSPRREMSFTHLLRHSPPAADTIQLPPLSSVIPWPTCPTPSRPSHEYSQATTNSADVIDLTRDSSPPPYNNLPSHSMPRRQHSQEPARKRRRITRETPEVDVAAPGPSASTSQQTSQSIPHFELFDFVDLGDEENSEIEQIDLTAVEDEADLRKAQEEQKKQREAQKQRDRLQKESVANQNSDEGPPTLSTLSCIICMDNVTNLTATHCGHLFCHECLTQALIAGEKDTDSGKGAKCPVCRTSVHRIQRGNQKLPHVIPLEIKVRRKSDKAKGKERATMPIAT